MVEGPQGMSSWSAIHLEPTGWLRATWPSTTFLRMKLCRGLISTSQLCLAPEVVCSQPHPGDRSRAVVGDPDGALANGDAHRAIPDVDGFSFGLTRLDVDFDERAVAVAGPDGIGAEAESDRTCADGDRTADLPTGGRIDLDHGAVVRVRHPDGAQRDLDAAQHATHANRPAAEPSRGWIDPAHRAVPVRDPHRALAGVDVARLASHPDGIPASPIGSDIDRGHGVPA